jgi:hypothetical protein
MVCLTASTHAKNHAYSTLFGSSIVQLQLFAGYLITAACRGLCMSWKSGCSLQGHSDRRTHLTRYIDVNNILVYWATCFGHMQLFAAICWLLCCSCLHRVCAACPQPGTGCRFALIGTTRGMSRSITACLLPKLCRQLFANYSGYCCMHRGLCSMS